MRKKIQSATQRTNQQSRALYLWLTWVSETLNDAGLDMRKVLKPTYNIPWTKENAHDHLWIPIQEAMYNTNSTVFLHKQEQIDQIVKVITRELGEKHGVEFPPFPVDEKKQLQKLGH